jgi:glycine hydroxymethyltransferase
LILIDLTNKEITGKKAAKALDRAGIELNYNTVPFDPRKPFSPSGIRLGTPAITSRGMKETEMKDVGRFIDEAVDAAKRKDDDALDRIFGNVKELTANFPAPGLD